MDMVFSPTITMAATYTLSGMLEDHHSLFLEVRRVNIMYDTDYVFLYGVIHSLTFMFNKWATPHTSHVDIIFIIYRSLKIPSCLPKLIGCYTTLI